MPDTRTGALRYTAGMDVEFARALPFPVALGTLLDCGWNYDFEGEVRFVPPSHLGRPEWQSSRASEWPAIRQILEAKAADGYEIRLILSYESTSFQAAFQFFEGGDVTMEFGRVRPHLDGTDCLTDANWYVSRIVLPWINHGALVERVGYSEMRCARVPSGLIETEARAA